VLDAPSREIVTLSAKVNTEKLTMSDIISALIQNSFRERRASAAENSGQLARDP
jgi:hypothetical protein